MVLPRNKKAMRLVMFLLIIMSSMIIYSTIIKKKDQSENDNINELKKRQILNDDKKVSELINIKLGKESYNYSYIKLYPMVHIYENSSVFWDYSAIQKVNGDPSLYLRLFKVYKRNPDIYFGNNTWVAGYVNLDLIVYIMCENCWG